MKIFTFCGFTFILLFLFGCEEQVDMEAEKAQILKIMAADDQELLDGVLKEDDTDTGESINLAEGNMERITRAEANKRNQTLLDRGKFVRIENLDGPVIHISPDGNMAWVAVRTKFVIAYNDSTGEEKEWEGIEARLEVYEKEAGAWDAVVCAQTF